MIEQHKKFIQISAIFKRYDVQNLMLTLTDPTVYMLIRPFSDLDTHALTMTYVAMPYRFHQWNWQGLYACKPCSAYSTSL